MKGFHPRHFRLVGKKIEATLCSLLPNENDSPRVLHQAMRYAVLSGGKRIRPILTLGACQAVSGKQADAMFAACALEMIHSYSLVHDDLPCMDNDMIRRGKPSCHAKFGEVTALLAGDALLTKAFNVLSHKGGSKHLQAIQWISEAIGNKGMVGGQALDIQFQGKKLDLPILRQINANKSGALIAVCTRVGAYLGCGTKHQVSSLHRYGKYVGLLFQIVDDIMDGQGYARALGIQKAREEATLILAKAKRELLPFGTRGHFLKDIADFIATRKY